MVMLLVIITTLQTSARSLPQDSKTDDAVLQLVQTWLNAESEGDSAALDKLIAEDFVGTGPGGNILNKTDIVPPGGGERPKMPKSRVKESTVRVFGNTAVVMGSVAYETVPQPAFRFTLVFLNRGQGWQMIAAHLANVPPEK
jgi:ketosteroid isomerase-like protein